MVMILLLLVAAFPLSYYIMSSWLQNFAYRIDIGWQVFALAGMISVLFAILTISFHAIKAAMRNPVHSLRSE